MNDPHLPDALDRRIEETLRRRFAPPATLDSLAARTRPRAERQRVPWGLVLAATATAASLALVWWTLAHVRPAGPAVVVVHRRGSSGPTLVAEAAFCRIIGPVIDGLPEAGAVHSPDLARLYRDMDACQRESVGEACGDGDLAERLSTSYGQPLALRPEASGVLHGPFGSDEWPTGTIVTGPSDGLTSVLVADRGSTLDCCVRMELPESSGLNLFHLQVGEVVLTEITPAPAPRLLPYFQ